MELTATLNQLVVDLVGWPDPSEPRHSTRRREHNCKLSLVRDSQKRTDYRYCEEMVWKRVLERGWMLVTLVILTFGEICGLIQFMGNP